MNPNSYIDTYPVGPSGMPGGTPVMDVFSMNANQPWQNPPVSVTYGPPTNDIPPNRSNVKVGEDGCDC